MKQVLGAYLISGGAYLKGGLAPAGPPPVATGLYVHTLHINKHKYI